MSTQPERETIRDPAPVQSDSVLEVTADDPATIERELNAAVNLALRHAMKQGRHGIFVTQHTYTSYSVAVSRDVPYGQTYERRAAQDSCPDASVDS